ncbi:MAG: S1 RNA-binding domain-containing protein, partial [Chloroflexota bacterium]|nr:S1 RNA-binding domain-containing protein [Chloroflexota bacterium]
VDDDREQYLTHYLGRKVSLKVIECDPAKERIVFSERAALAKQGKRKALLHDLKEGDIIKGVVTNITKFGAFARLDDGIEGLPHISSMNFPAGGTHVDEFLFQDQPVRVCILNNDAHKRRLL